jgi:polyphosphate kinase 2 (PPK2 family)
MEAVDETQKSYPSYEELVARLAAVEQAQAAKQAREAIDLARLNNPGSTKPVSHALNAFGRLQAEARLRRVEKHEREVQAQRKQAEKDAPKQARREREIAVLLEKDAADRGVIADAEERLRRRGADRVALARKPL